MPVHLALRATGRRSRRRNRWVPAVWMRASGAQLLFCRDTRRDTRARAWARTFELFNCSSSSTLLALRLQVAHALVLCGCRGHPFELKNFVIETKQWVNCGDEGERNTPLEWTLTLLHICWKFTQRTKHWSLNTVEQFTGRQMMLIMQDFPFSFFLSLHLLHHHSRRDSAEVVTPSAHYNVNCSNQNPSCPGWDACFPRLNDISYAQWLPPPPLFLHYFKDSTSIKSEHSVCVCGSNIDVKFISVWGPANTKVALNTICTAYCWQLKRSSNGNGIVVHGRSSCVFQLQRWCGSAAWVLRANRSNSRLVWDPLPSISRQDAFNEPQCVWTVASRHAAV